jgi:hypothetical protein
MARVGVGGGEDFGKRTLGAFAPMPGVLERLDLGVGHLARWSLEQDVVAGLAVERRVEVDQG